MKNFFIKLIENIISFFSDDKTKDLEPVIKEIKLDDINTQEEAKEAADDLKTTSNEVYEMLSKKQRQSYLKTIGLYTGKIDGIIGSGSKLAIKQFNIIFLNKNSETYTEETDKKLRAFYNSYTSSKFMLDTDWAFFKNLKKSEYKCKCNGLCNGYPHKIYKRLVMVDQYERNLYDKSVTISSGVRCKKHNKNVGGVSNSKHLYGRASDSRCGNNKAAARRKEVYKLPFVNYSYAINTYYLHKDIKY